MERGRQGIRGNLGTYYAPGINPNAMDWEHKSAYLLHATRSVYHAVCGEEGGGRREGGGGRREQKLCTASTVHQW